MQPKKLTALLLLLALLATLLAGCAGGTNTNSTAPSDGGAPGQSQAGSLPDGSKAPERATIRLAGMTGPTAMGMVKLLADNERRSSQPL